MYELNNIIDCYMIAFDMCWLPTVLQCVVVYTSALFNVLTLTFNRHILRLQGEYQLLCFDIGNFKCFYYLYVVWSL